MSLPTFWEELALSNPPEDFTVEFSDLQTWIEEATEQTVYLSLYSLYDFKLKETPSGQKILASRAEATRRYLAATLFLLPQWDGILKQTKTQHLKKIQETKGELDHSDLLELAKKQRQLCFNVVNTLIGRKLPLQEQDLVALLQWWLTDNHSGIFYLKTGHVVRALERYAESNQPGEELQSELKKFIQVLSSYHAQNIQNQARTLEKLFFSADESESESEHPAPNLDSPEPAPAGSPFVLQALKLELGMLTGENVVETIEKGPDLFPMLVNSPSEHEHDLLSVLFDESEFHISLYYDKQFELEKTSLHSEYQGFSRAEYGRFLVAAAERHAHALLIRNDFQTETSVRESRALSGIVLRTFRHTDLELNRDQLVDLFLYLSILDHREPPIEEKAILQWLDQLKQCLKETPLSPGERYVLDRFRTAIVYAPSFGVTTTLLVQVNSMLDDGRRFCLTPGNSWSDEVNADYSVMNSKERVAWNGLFEHLLTTDGSRPSKKWLKTARTHIEAIGAEKVKESIERWFPLVDKPNPVQRFSRYDGDSSSHSQAMDHNNAFCLKGLLWSIQLLPEHHTLARYITDVALSAYKKIPGVGPRAVKVGNAAIYALSEIGNVGAVGQLAQLKVRVKFGTAQKEIEKAFNKAAEALQLPRDEIEEMAVPAYGLAETGRLTESVGDYQVELLVKGAKAQLNWFDIKGKQLKSVPAKVRQQHKEELKELKQSQKDIQSMLPVQRDRLDSMFLNEKNWSWEKWEERYLNHPLVGTLTQRLIWCIDGKPVLFVEGKPVDIEGAELTPTGDSQVSLWHPVGREIEEITRWRERLEELEITQPFKQAHRELYRLTPAEENTETYSNRFAAHVIRQHQFNSLCAARGWKNKLRLMVDDSYPPAHKELPQWGLRAEFWVETIGEDYGTDTNDAGVYLYLTTDQVRFYRTEAAENTVHAVGGPYTSRAAGPGNENINEPLSLTEIPPLVFNEIMRDVDLFVGVASVGNDPNWQDGGPEGHYREYWHSYSFGEISETAQTRKQTLERLIPRLKIADRCSFDDRFLIVKGDIRTYKIHLGSGNILMEPNDEYLCIVPDARQRATGDALYLPFEGDNMLSIVLSKAFLLADDKKIKDKTILQQIK